jgi:hypothetical protein
MWVVSSTLRPLYTQRNGPGTHWIGGCVGLRTNLDAAEKINVLTLTALEHRPLGRSACRLSLYQLQYPGYLYLYLVKLMIESWFLKLRCQHILLVNINEVDLTWCPWNMRMKLIWDWFKSKQSDILVAVNSLQILDKLSYVNSMKPIYLLFASWLRSWMFNQ